MGLESFFRAKSYKDVFIHIAIIIFLSLLLILLFFYAYLPISTNHNGTAVVPQLTGKTLDDAVEMLDDASLDYEITPDSGYSSDYPAQVIIRQFPSEGEKVKENRKIHITLNAKNPPKVKMPYLVNNSLKNAELVLTGFGLELGKVDSIKDPAAVDAVLEQWYKGKKIKEGELVPKGAKIDVVIGK